MTNPLLNTKGLPVFSRIQPQHVEPAVDRLLNENRAEVRRLLSSNSEYTWENLLQPLEELEDKLNRAWSPVAHMNAVVNTPALRASYSACLPKLSEYATEMGQDEELFQAFRQIAEGPEYRNLDTAQRKIVDNDMRDFRLSGIELGPEAKQRYKIIMQELSSLQARFEDNLLDATNEWSKPVTDESVLAGLPKSAVDLAKQNAQNNELNGWLFNLESPSFQPVMNYADNRQLRREMYEAYVTRASDQGPHDKRLDNTPVMASILALRHEAAQLLGFDNYAERSLATKMAQSTDQVLSFLNDLAERSISLARKDLDEVRAFARDLHGPEELEAWDIPYYSEQLRQHKFSFSQEQLKPYFPEPKVLPGMFAVVQRLYGLQITEKQGIDTWHPDVRFFEIYDDQGKLRGQFYLDLYARPKKRGGAWMDECITRKGTLDGVQIPVAYLSCNFSPPIGDDPAL
ncbi:MAG: M3 family metallopeptidase, partial [Gammaproteobacteria bacterium]